MKQVVYGKFGEGDLFTLPAHQGGRQMALDLLDDQGQLRFSMGAALAEAWNKRLRPSELGLDLLVLATHVYAADTRISRALQSQDNWTREIELIVPVSAPAAWEAAKGTLTRLLNFLSGDLWTIVFRARPEEWEELATFEEEDEEENDEVPAPFTKVQLFSGGLDSLIGAIDNLAQGEVPLLISHAGDGATSNPQQACFDQLKEVYPDNDFDRLRFWLNVPASLFGARESENTTRGRSFLFFALGIFAGSGFGGPFVLETPENGLIALNVPLDLLRLGSLSTHTTHPYYMSLWNKMLQEVGIPGSIENPYWNQTKGEMAAGCRNRRLLRELIPVSLSCSSPAKARWQGRSAGHCGYCLPCLIRRASIKHANIPDATTYTLDDLNTDIKAGSARGKQIRSFQAAVERLNTSPGIARWLIHKSGPLPATAAELTELAGVYERGMQEIARLLRRTTTTG
ncbi:Qat anti-phage system QueC-like protein QatC [Flaviaesturariibacter amylovorans]|uniref:7-cyano-7-deazaguanine synthase n=1 Tax=Flaviaesturariibacter amylovorans TaxID=1084520 RepID=A0ABP8H622_9BACT